MRVTQLGLRTVRTVAEAPRGCALPSGSPLSPRRHPESVVLPRKNRSVLRSEQGVAGGRGGKVGDGGAEGAGNVDVRTPQAVSLFCSCPASAAGGRGFLRALDGPWQRGAAGRLVGLSRVDEGSVASCLRCAGSQRSFSRSDRAWCASG